MSISCLELISCSFVAHIFMPRSPSGPIIMALLSLAAEDCCVACGRVQIGMAAEWAHGLLRPPTCASCQDALIVRKVFRWLQPLGTHRATVATSILQFFPSKLERHRFWVMQIFLEGKAWTYSPFHEINQAYNRVVMGPPIEHAGAIYWPGHRRLDCTETLTTKVIQFLSPGATVSANLRECTCREPLGKATCARCILAQLAAGVLIDETSTDDCLLETAN